MASTTFSGPVTSTNGFIGALTGNVTGNVTGTVTNGVVTAESYANPAWITSLAKSKVDLSNVTNESKATMFTDSALTGIPTAPTAASSVNTTQIATTAFVKTAVDNLIANAPAALDTLDELAAALGDDQNYASTITTALSNKAPLANPTFTGTVNGITATMVGLGSVTNESKATMFTNPIFTGVGATSFSNIVSLTGNTASTTYTDGTLVVTGGVGISGKIFTNSTAQHTGLGIGTAASATIGEIRATNVITAFYSDERLKENIVEIDNALSKIMLLKGVTYNSNAIAAKYGYTNTSTQVGVLAQDVLKVQPEAVKPAPFDIKQLDDGSEISASGENYLTVQYEKLIPLLIQCIKELNIEIQDLKSIK